MPNEAKGLTSAQAKNKLEKVGPNVLPEKSPPSDYAIFLSQLKNPLVYILVAAAFVTFMLQHTTDTVIIFVAILINTTLGFFQERRASIALQALKKLIHPTTQVKRDGRLREISANEVVPGDIVILNQGDKLPADGELIEANRLFINEAILTGESVAVTKKLKGEVFAGTIVSSGHGSYQVKRTGAETEIGKIAKSVQEPGEDTPLRKELTSYSRYLSVLVFVLTVVVFSVGLVSGRDVLEIFTTAVALAVSAIPEGLLVALTAVLAIGMQRILKRKGLVRNLLSAETLGGVTTICIDKTGTLTEGELKVVEVVGSSKELVEQSILANDLDDPIVIAAWDWALRQASRQAMSKLKNNHPRFDSIPFSSAERFFASLNKMNSQSNMLYVNGAPDYVLSWSKLPLREKAKVKKRITELTGEGMRVVGFARKVITSTKTNINSTDVKKDLVWVGMLAFSDPVRVGVKSALQKTRSAGVELIVITGDYPDTAISVMGQLDLKIDRECVMLGENLTKLSSTQLAKKLKGKERIRLFARTSPEQKLIIVRALKKNGEVVAMMGDGVNDAPALNHADIGVVVGEATDVAKESADLVLMDSSFATIVSAIEEGRGIYDNIRKIILYLMSDAFEEIIAVVGTIILGLPLPVTAAQILWINLVSDGFPDLALTIDPKASGIMKRAPRDPTERLVAGWMKALIVIVSVTGGLLALLLFISFYKITADAVLARSIAFATLGINSLVYVFSVRTLTKPFWEEKILANKWLVLAVGAGLVLQLAPFGSGAMRDFFGLVPLKFGYWMIVFTTSITMFIIIEVAKVVFRKKLTVQQTKP